MDAPTKPPDAQKFQMVAQTQARALGLAEPLTGPIRLWVSLHPPGKKSIDLDNSMKAAIDALNGIAWMDDSQLVEILALGNVGLIQAQAAGRELVRTDAVHSFVIERVIYNSLDKAEAWLPSPTGRYSDGKPYEGH